jgi:hypothetical protein
MARARLTLSEIWTGRPNWKLPAAFDGPIIAVAVGFVALAGYLACQEAGPWVTAAGVGLFVASYAVLLGVFFKWVRPRVERRREEVVRKWKEEGLLPEDAS